MLDQKRATAYHVGRFKRLIMAGSIARLATAEEQSILVDKKATDCSSCDELMDGNFSTYSQTIVSKWSMIYGPDREFTIDLAASTTLKTAYI